MYVHYQTSKLGYTNKDFMKDFLYLLTGVQDDGTQASTINLDNLSGSCDKDKSFIDSSIYDARWQYHLGGNFTGSVGGAPEIFLGPTENGYSNFNDLTTLNAKRYDVAYSTDPTKTGWFYLDATDPSLASNWKTASFGLSTVANVKNYQNIRDFFIVKSPISDSPTTMKYFLVDRFDDNLRTAMLDFDSSSKIVCVKYRSVGVVPNTSTYYGSTPDKLINVGDIMIEYIADDKQDISLSVDIKQVTSINPTTDALTWRSVPLAVDGTVFSTFFELDNGSSTMAFYNLFIKQECILMSTFVNGITSGVSGIAERSRRSKWDTPSLNYPTVGKLSLNGFAAEADTFFNHTRILQPFKMKEAILDGQDTTLVKFPLSTYYGANTGLTTLLNCIPTVVTRDENLKSTYQLFELCTSNFDINHEGGSISAICDIWLFNNGKGEHGDTVTIDSKTYVIWQSKNGIGRVAVRLG